MSSLHTRTGIVLAPYSIHWLWSKQTSAQKGMYLQFEKSSVIDLFGPVVQSHLSRPISLGPHACRNIDDARERSPPSRGVDYRAFFPNGTVTCDRHRRGESTVQPMLCDVES